MDPYELSKARQFFNACDDAVNASRDIPELGIKRGDRVAIISHRLGVALVTRWTDSEGIFPHWRAFSPAPPIPLSPGGTS